MRLLQAWLSLPDAQLLREQLIAIAVSKTVEAAKDLCNGLDEPGATDRSAQIAAREAMQAEAFLELLEKMKSGDYQFLRVKPIVNQNLL